MRTVSVALIAAVAGGVAGGAVVATVDHGDTKTVVQQAPIERATEDEPGGLSAAAIYRRDSAGVVFIRADVVRQTTSPYDLGQIEQRGTSTGTGFVIDREGTIVTNAHVVENATDVTVRFADQKTVPARVRGADPSTDLAVLKVDPAKASLKPLALGSSRDVRVGDPTVAIGNPFGLEQTLTTGVISAKQRRIDAPNGFSISDVLQTDAAINPGNSGGPLIDAAGRVIGVNSAIRTGGAGEGSIGIGFAIPIDTVKRIVPDLVRGGRVERAFLGVSTVSARGGALVTDVEPGSPAEGAGLRPGDLLTTVAGRKVLVAEDVTAAVEANRAGDEVEVRFTRAGEEKTARATLVRRPPELGG